MWHGDTHLQARQGEEVYPWLSSAKSEMAHSQPPRPAARVTHLKENVNPTGYLLKCDCNLIGALALVLVLVVIT